ncbi:MAG: hypothetical protein HYU68_13510 [Bacteroidetes bacterium]|nr:hypothetical protein [Bacteroidota bacterium]
MTPFVIWLKKEEIDELITHIIRADSSDKLTNEVIDSGELKELTEKLLVQNAKLIQLFRKIEPLNPIQKKAAQTYGVKQKCNHYQEQFEEMMAHCNIFGHPSIKNSNEHNNLACTDCPVRIVLE